MKDEGKMALYFKNRHDDTFELEKIEGEKALKFLYEKPLGQLALHVLVKRKLISRTYGWLQDLPSSQKKIDGFVAKHNIDLSEAISTEFSCFNDFFTRRLKPEARPIEKDSNIFASPADGRVFAYDNLKTDSVVQLKGIVYDLKQLLGDEALAKKYEGGVCMVVRLSPVDYHRYHYPDHAKILRYEQKPGAYYSVNPIALNKVINLYVENKREWMLLETENFGNVVMMEVGATCVGTIFQNHNVGDTVRKGDEKGYFKFGGSTVVLFIEKDQIQVDEDLIRNTLEGYETKVNMGERLGIKK